MARSARALLEGLTNAPIAATRSDRVAAIDWLTRSALPWRATRTFGSSAMQQRLETKFFVPSKRRGVVPRARLRERLERITEVKVTLVAAPAGFGKTTLLADCLAGMSAET